MADLFSWFTSYLNLSKLTAVTVPGMVVAFALILVLGPIPCRDNKACPFCPTTLKPEKSEEQTPADGNVPTVKPEQPNAQKPAAGNPPTPKPEQPKGQKPAVGNIWVHTSLDNLGDEKIAGDIDKSIDNFENIPPPAAVSAPAGGNPQLALGQFQRIGKFCDAVPRYFAANGITVIPSDEEGKETTAAAKKAQKLRKLADVQQELYKCYSQVQLVGNDLAAKTGYLDKFITQANTDLQGLSTQLITAQHDGETLVADSVRARVEDKRRYLNWAQEKEAALKNASTEFASLQSRVQAMLNAINSPVPDVKSDSNAVVDAYTLIVQNLFKFLLFSLVIGQILDPIQRGVMSFFGPRRNFFGAFNKVYGQRGDGEFRYGDRRLEPWVSSDAKGTIDLNSSKVGIANLRPNTAGRLFVNDRNIYDKDYAIGAGYITQSEAKSIDDDWFAQSQLTSGLIFPMALVSVCLAIRAICCSAFGSQLENCLKGIWLSAAAITFAIPAGFVLMLAGLLFSSRKYWKVFRDGSQHYLRQLKKAGDLKEKRAEEKREAKHKMASAGAGASTSDENPPPQPPHVAEEQLVEQEDLPPVYRVIAFAVIGILLACFWIWQVICFFRGNYLILSAEQLSMIASPSLFLGLLWISGLDRLHKYYSELQARIAGNILRLGTNTEQKFIDLLGDRVTACALMDKIRTLREAEEGLDKYLKGINCPKDVKEAAAASEAGGTSAPGPATTQPPGDGPGGKGSETSSNGESKSE